jgi:hypothetical protein
MREFGGATFFILRFFAEIGNNSNDHLKDRENGR